MTTFFVTGGAGFIGTHFCKSVQERGHKAFVFDKVFGQDLGQRYGSAYDNALFAAMERVAPDWVIHLAATPGVAGELDTATQDIVNTKNVLEAMEFAGVKKILFPSTGSVYGKQYEFHTIEWPPMRRQEGFYAAAKLAAENLIQVWCDKHNNTGVILRLGTILGPGNNKGFARDFVAKLQKDPTRLEVWGDGKQVKSYLHVDDLISAIWTTISGAPPSCDVFNVAHDEHASIRDLIPIVCEEMGVTPDVVYGDGKSGGFGDIPVIKLSNAKLKGLGWAPTKSIEQAVRDNVRWLLKQSERKAS